MVWISSPRPGPVSGTRVWLRSKSLHRTRLVQGDTRGTLAQVRCAQHICSATRKQQNIAPVMFTIYVSCAEYKLVHNFRYYNARPQLTLELHR